MNRISSQLNEIKSHYTAIVIGSGYGGGIAASRLARAGQSVCILERGKEFLPGEFPDTLSEARSNTQIDMPSRHIGSEIGLYDFRVNDDINVLLGCGLGGTSLINANVVIEADPRVFEDPAWPDSLKASIKPDLKDGYFHAREMLAPQPYPGPPGYPILKKLEAMEKSAQEMKEKFYRPDLAVTFNEHKKGVNHVGVPQTPCINCGDCCSGCNYTSKNTVQMNYLPDAWNHGAEIFTGISVRFVEKQGAKWLVHYQPVEVGREKFDAPMLFVAADIVVLAAGTLGSTEILLRSRDNGLRLSERLGKGFSGNGDVLAFGYNNDQEINGIGWGTRKPDADDPVGPTITGIIDTRAKAKNYKDGMSIEEGAIPGAMSPILPFAFATISKVIGVDTDTGLQDFVQEATREIVSLTRGSYHGAVNQTQTFLVMTHDSSTGIMELDNDRLRIRWPNVGKEPIFKKVSDSLKKVIKALGGTYVPSPTWNKLFGHNLTTVHPLGGCGMGKNASSGVVNHEGQVFSPDSADELYEGLYVMDGAVIPASVGTNPLLTISAIAERNIARLAQKRGWTINYKLPSKPKKKSQPPMPGIQFTETMAGYYSAGSTESYVAAAKQGKKDKSDFQFTLTIISDDLEAMIKDEKHQAKMFGTVEANALSSKPLTVHGGKFSLFEKDPEVVNGRRMWYRMKLKSQAGEDFFFVGYKLIKDDPGFDLWSDTTTLYITVHAGTDSNAPVHGKGVLKIAVADFAKQITTVEVTNVVSANERLKYTTDFGKLFAGALFDTYGGVFAGLNYFDPGAALRKKRPLRVSAPEVYPVKTKDGVVIRLTRYHGGKKGPVILSHGLGVSSRIFSTDTCDTNMVEYLFANGYDVWLLDYRASIDLPAAKTQFSADDIAQYDYPAAVAFVRKEADSASVQMVAHCYGSTAWTMSMLGGWLKGVRSAVCSQVSTHMKVPLATKLKTGLHIPAFLERLGIDSLSAYVDDESGWLDKFLNHALRFYPIQKEERCNNPVCHRITFLYGQLYEHDQLTDLIHGNLHEMFGLANIKSFEHLATMAREGQIVNFKGEDVYLPHLERMAMPITFISGEENECFLPASTEISYNLLREKNGRGLYQRHVIPNYGHIDCIYGKNAARDVYPFILDHLDGTNNYRDLIF